MPQPASTMRHTSYGSIWAPATGGSKSVSTPPTDGVFYAPNHSDQPCRHGPACSGIERPADRSHECHPKPVDGPDPSAPTDCFLGSGPPNVEWPAASAPAIAASLATVLRWCAVPFAARGRSLSFDRHMRLYTTRCGFPVRASLVERERSVEDVELPRRCGDSVTL